jgi:thymidine kinase
VSVVVTVQSGFDLDYYSAQVNKEPERSPGGYYINASIRGEVPGRWFGPAGLALSLSGDVDADQFRQVYSLVDPQTGTRLGGPRRDYTRSYEVQLAQLRAAEPHATAERVHQLEHQARQATRQSPAYTDVTLNFSKSVSLLHGSIRENAARARDAGDLVLAAWWDERDVRFCEILQSANAAAMTQLQTWAGVTRTGYHGRLVNGRELGKWEPAELVGTSWLQSTSRDGEMHDHIHNPVLPRVRTLSDGKWRASDTMAIRRQIPAIQATAAAYMEAALSREFGVQWVPRPDGMGNEIRGTTQQEIDAFSSRRNSVTAKQADLAEQFRSKYGRAPNQREMFSIHRTAWAATRESKPEDSIDFDAAAREWGAEWARKFGTPLASLASRVSNMRGPAHAPRPAPDPEPADPHALGIAAREALARVQAKHATWTRADLMRQVKVALPAAALGLDPDAAVRLVNELTDRTLAGEFEPVQCLEAPELIALPDSLRRPLDGRSIYTRPGSVRYATRVQLSLEEHLLANAQCETAARLTREQAAAHLGAEPDVLTDHLTATTSGARAEMTTSGLRLDQAAALFHALTSARTTEVLVGPAGSGKTRALAEAARAWREATGAQVIGLTASQAARNVLAQAGVDLAENTASFLGHLPGRRGARGIRADMGRGALLLVDEASMMSTSDLADIIEFAARDGHKVLAAGDQQQLAAVEGSGAMKLLADELGYVQLTEAVRFTHEWERDASLELRLGQASALEAYDEQGRICGDDPDLALDMARAAYLGSYLQGRDVLMIARAHETCRELSRRVRDDLVHLGLVDDVRTVELRDGARAGAADIIVARVNDHALEAGETGRTLANGDVMQVLKVNRDSTVTVRRRTERDPRTGQTGWSQTSFRYGDSGNCDLAYAVTGHSAQGLTVSHGIAVVTGSEARQWLYSAMTRGADLNQAVAFTQPGRPADPAGGTRAAPDLSRYARVAAERAGEPLPARAMGWDPDPREPMAVLSDVIARDEAQESALTVLRRQVGDADHLAILDAIWQGETFPARKQAWTAAIRRALPHECRSVALDGGTATWLWRTLRSVDAAGLDAEQVATDAISSSPLTGARDVGAVIDARIRWSTTGIAPATWRPWSERMPRLTDPARQQFITELAALMDARRERIGEQAAESQPAWALSALGPVPHDPVDRLGWQHRASAVGGYRELYGFESDTDPIGPEPVNSPEARQAWIAACDAQLDHDHSELTQLPDSALLFRRTQYQAETAWAPPYPGRELRQVRIAHLAMAAREVRHQAETEAAQGRGDRRAADKHAVLAQSARAAGVFYAERTVLDEQLDAARKQWGAKTAPARLSAVHADAELRRRHPDWHLDALATAEPNPLPDELPEISAAQGLNHSRVVAATLHAVRTETTLRPGTLRPSQHVHQALVAGARPSAARSHRGTVLQPPKPAMTPPRSIQPQRELEPQA